MGIVTIGSDEYTVYGQSADDPPVMGWVKYINGSNTKGAKKWRAIVDADNKSRTAIDAARFIDSFQWEAPYDDTATRYDDPLFIRAAYEMMMLVALSADVVNKEDQGSNIASLGAGSASISFFEKTTAEEGTALILPAVIDRLIGEFLLAGQDVNQIIGGFFYFTSSAESKACHDDRILYGRTAPWD